MSQKPLDEKTALALLSGKRNLDPKPPKPKPDDIPADLTVSDSDWVRPEWHKWVYGGQRNPILNG